MPKTFSEHSRSNFTSEHPSIEQINTGCFQRIANATELMATNFLKLQQENEYLRNRNKFLITENERLTRQSAAYKGKFNSLKNKKNG